MRYPYSIHIAQSEEPEPGLPGAEDPGAWWPESDGARTAIRMEGYEIVADTKVTLNPVILVPKRRGA